MTLQPVTPAQTIGLVGGAGGFNLSSAEIANLMDGFSSITIGRVADGTGVVMVGGSAVFTDPVTVVGGSIAGNGTLTSTGNPVTLTARTGGITDGNGGTVNVVAGNLTASAVTGIDLDTAIDALNAATVSGIGAIDLANTGALTVINASTVNGHVAIGNTTGDMVIGTVTAGSGAVKLNTEGALLDGNGITNNVTASADSTFTALGVIGMAADPIEVNVNFGTLGVAAQNQLGGLSVTINGTVSPSNTLIATNSPPGAILFNGVPLGGSGSSTGGGSSGSPGGTVMGPQTVGTLMQNSTVLIAPPALPKDSRTEISKIDEAVANTFLTEGEQMRQVADDLTQLSLEELMSVKVASVSQRVGKSGSSSSSEPLKSVADDLTQLSLTELMTMKVTAVSKKVEKAEASRACAAQSRSSLIRLGNRIRVCTK